MFTKDKNLNDKFAWGTILVVFLGCIIFVFIQNREISLEAEYLVGGMTEYSIKKREYKTSLFIDYGNGKNRVFEGNFFRGMNLADVFKGVEASTGMIFSFKNNSLASVDGVKPREPKSWKLYINNAKHNEIVLDKEIAPGDKIILRYE